MTDFVESVRRAYAGLTVLRIRTLDMNLEALWIKALSDYRAGYSRLHVSCDLEAMIWLARTFTVPGSLVREYQAAERIRGS